MLAILVTPNTRNSIVTELKEDIEAACQCAVQLSDDQNDPSGLADSIAFAPPDNVVIVSGIDVFGDDEWKHLDMLRSRITRRKPVVLVMTPESFARLTTNAPNIASWLGGSVWTRSNEEEGLSEADRQLRLAALRAHTGMSDEDVIRRAQNKALPGDPEYTEWLILLNRADLVDH